MAETSMAALAASPMDRVRAVRPGAAALSLVAGVVLWEVAGRLLGLAYLPPFSDVVAQLIELTRRGLIAENLAFSLMELGVGFSISVVVGIAIGLLMGVYPKIDAALDVYVYGLLSAPVLVFAPIFFFVFGAGSQTIIGVVIVYSIFIIIIDTAAAVQSVPPAMVEMAKSFCASERQLLIKIILPAATPMIMAGVHAGAGRAVKGMINGEMFIAVVGLGAVLMSAGAQFEAAQVFAVMMVVVGVALVLLWALDRIDARLTHWMPVSARVSSSRGARGGRVR